MHKQQRLFDVPAKPRAKPRKLMHVIDAGPGYDDEDLCQFKCYHCGHESEWLLYKFTEAKRGVPCPKCNKSEGENE